MKRLDVPNNHQSRQVWIQLKKMYVKTAFIAVYSNSMGLPSATICITSMVI